MPLDEVTLDLTSGAAKDLAISLPAGFRWVRTLRGKNASDQQVPMPDLRVVWRWGGRSVEWPSVRDGDLVGWDKTAADVDALLDQVGGSTLEARIDLVTTSGPLPWTKTVKVQR